MDGPQGLDPPTREGATLTVGLLYSCAPLIPWPQALLEMPSTRERLSAVKELLQNTVKYMSAQAALQSAFKGSSGKGVSGEAQPPPGGPD